MSEARRVAAETLNEPSGSEREAVLNAFSQRVEEAIGAEAAERFSWAKLATLRQSKWDQALALERMKKLGAFAAKHAEYFESAEPAEFAGQAAIGMTSHLPTRNSRGELVMLIDGQKLGEYAKAHTVKDMLRFSVFYMTLLLHDDETQLRGAVILENLEDYPIFALNSMKGMGPSAMKASFGWLGAAPLRLRGLYVCKQPWCAARARMARARPAPLRARKPSGRRAPHRYVGMMLALARPFMSKKLKERTHLYGSNTPKMLEEAGLSPEQVPPQYGGTLQGFDPAWYLSQAR